MSENFYIHPDITKAETLPARFYKEDAIFNSMKEKVFLKSWQWIGDIILVEKPLSIHPFILLDGFLTEPIVLTKDSDDNLNCLTNDCTHRGNIVALNTGESKKLTSSYHGRRCNLKCEFEYMPEF